MKHKSTIHPSGTPYDSAQVTWLQLQRAERAEPAAAAEASKAVTPRKARRQLRSFECPEPVKLGST
jgi:hypothetical protein